MDTYSSRAPMSIRWSALAASVCVLGSPARAIGAQDRATAVLAAEDARRTAILQNDTSALARLLDDSLVVTLADGTRRGKAEEVAQNRASDRGIEAWESRDVLVRVHSVVAVVTGHARLRDTVRGQPRHFGFFFTHVWAQREGRWVLIARHMSGRHDL